MMLPLALAGTTTEVAQTAAATIEKRNRLI
jgi:hypothetical protein